MAEPVSAQPFLLAHAYRQQAVCERDALSPEQRTLLGEVAGADWDRAACLAYLYLIESQMKAKRIQKKELLAHFPGVSKGAITKWFTKGEISGKNLAKLLSLPWFAGVRPSPDDIILHGWRQGITRVCAEVLKDETCSSVLRFDELQFLIHVHRLDEVDIDRAFTMLSEELLRFYPNHDVKWLEGVVRAWGTSYRLFALETEDGRPS